MTRDRFELLPDSKSPVEDQCCRHLRTVFSTHPCLYCFVFIAILVLDLAECTNDWLFLKDILFLEQGLVYGPPRRLVVMVLVLTTAIGSLAIVFEIFNISREFITGTPWVDLDLCSAIVVWLDEVPTLTVNFIISLCHNEPISYFQLIKALIVIVSVVLRVVIPLIRTYLEKKSTVHSTPKFRKTIYKGVNTIGLCVALSGASAVFIFTHVMAADEGKLQFRMPDEIWGGQFAYDQYFKNVGVFYQHEGLVGENDENYWLKLANIEEFLDMDTVHVKLSYTKQAGRIDKLVLHSYNSSAERYRECYIWINEDYAYTKCTFDLIPENSNQEKVTFRFNFLRPQLHLILGDISFNAKYQRSNICYSLFGNDTKLLLNETGNDEPTQMGRLLYLKLDTNLLSSHRLVLWSQSANQTTNYRLFNTSHVLLGAEEIWHTGLYGCECTGKRGPTFDGTLTVSC
ncbi:uncharacterized protein LOC128211171 [Mya arenaria]|uniref:uncharacterized protein LOC128211171 n=1 Tax=Mya arenaria TaxID=6604 RepID=UPI0022E4C9A3|nr:uncharacterized protein LOC128211171 [Mya arenaria]